MLGTTFDLATESGLSREVFVAGAATAPGAAPAAGAAAAAAAAGGFVVFFGMGPHK